MNPAGPRNPEAPQPQWGKPTSPRQNTKVTPPSVKRRRVDNQGLSKNYPEQPVTTGSERKETPGKSPRKLQELGPLNQRNLPAKTLQGRAHKSPRRQNGATETPQEPNTLEQQEGPQTMRPNHPTARAGEGQTETSEGGLTTKGSRDCKLRSELVP